MQNHLSEQDYRKETGFECVNFRSGRFVFQLSIARINVLLNSHTDNAACPRLEHALTNMAKACWYRCKAIYATCNSNHEFFILKQFTIRLETAGLKTYNDAYDDEEEERRGRGGEGEDEEGEGKGGGGGEEEMRRRGGEGAIWRKKRG